MRASKPIAGIVAIVVLATCSLAWGQAMVRLDSTVGLHPNGMIEKGSMLTFYIGLDNNFEGSVNVYGICNGFRIYSPEGATWTNAVGTLNPAYCWGDPQCTTEPMFSFARIYSNDVDGIGADTIGFAGFDADQENGLPADFEDTGYWITIGPIDGQPGDQIVLDSSYFYYMGYWDWVPYTPGWDGPHIFTIDPEIRTICLPQPTILKDVEMALEVQIINEPDPYLVDLESIRVEEKIKPMEPPVVDAATGIISAYINVLRFLGSAGYRPVTWDCDGVYSVSYSRTDGTDTTLFGDFSLVVYGGNVTLDDAVDINDVIFMVDYMFGRGPACPLPELMDVNQDGELSVKDINAIIELIK